MTGDLSAAPGGIDIRAVGSVAEAAAVARVLSEVWGGHGAGISADLLRALAHAGEYVVGLYDGERMIGASVGFFGPPASRTLHSHITGILPGYQARGLGRAIKQHQRDWALARGVDRLTWTFDPLIARNAHFNLTVLGARVTEYLVDQYGPIDDEINHGDESDRLLASWELTAPRSGQPTGVVAAVPIPRDVEAVRRESAAEAKAWRRRVRDRFLELLAEGLVVGGFDDEAGYLFVRPTGSGSATPI
ncbi:GNAT family N-acetyltransferase [Microbacterium sp. 22242]|uniref:GNAT family N-acetyltransferase n=1 Tax=Microbacterium sp. 22242 TaxID=3453896 RepID=UPI003F82A1BC